jgi:hypothetical protein
MTFQFLITVSNFKNPLKTRITIIKMMYQKINKQ